MDDAHISTSASSVDIAITSISKYDGLIDIPFTTKIVDHLVSLFNYFDIYAPRMSFMYSAVTYIRFLQLIGGAFMETNHETFTEGSLADKVINVISVFFYLVPLKFRNRNESIICFCINSVLVFFAIYMVATAFTYKKTSKVSKFSTVVLSIFISFGPFLLVPITADYAGFILSLEIVHSVPLKLTDILAVVSSVLIIFAYIWLLIKAYSKTLLLRPCSFQSIEGSPQYKLFITTTIVTFISSLTMCFSEVPALISIAISIIFYIYSATTVFNCGTFIKRRHQIMVLSGSIIGILLCIANLVIIFIKKRWGCEFFVGFSFVVVFTFIGISFVIKKREKIDLTTILCYLLLIFIPLLILMIMYKLLKKKLEKPIKIMEGIAHTRNIITMLTALVGRYLLQELDDPKNPDKKLMQELKLPEGFNLSCFGGSNTTAKIIDYVASQVSDATEEMSLIRSFEPKNKIINEVRKLLFGINLTFKNYLNNSYYVEIPTTISELSFIIANKAGKLLDIKQITPEVAKGSDSLSLRNNKRTSITKMNDALELLIIYVEDKNERYQKIFTAVLCVLISLNIIIYPTIYYFQIDKLRKNRIQILQSFTLLPKAVISGISASFNKIKDNIQQNDDTEQNRQEESIIKLFASISDGSSKTSIEISTMICFICLIIISCVSYYFAIHSYVVASTDLVHNCHHIDYLLGCVTYMYAAMSTIFNIALSTSDPIFNETVVNITNEIIELEDEITNLVNYFQFITLGGSESCEIPFKELGTIISNESLCINSSEPPETLLESVHCLSSEQQFFVFTALVMRYYNLMIEKIDLDSRNSTLEELWEIGPMELYQALFYPAEDMIIPVIVNSIEKQGIKQISDSVICIIITFVITIIIIITISEENKLLKFCLRLYLRCPAKALLSNQRIMSLISGNYEYSNEDLSAKHIGFSNEVVNKLNDVVIVCQEMTGKIISVNHTFEVMFGMKKEEVENMSIKDFFTEARFSSKDFVAKALTQKADLVYTTSHGDKFYLEFNITCISGRRIYSGRDLTQHVLHEKLLADERKKSDEILASIIPQMLVPKVHAGDTNISFSVQSATVLFLDVVGFTPWCGSHDAQYVMRMLNIMFKEFDAIANAHKTMTKIKCIGDCYMAAGGIFDEVNQPAVHAKEVVNFGRLVIKKLIKIDENENETLKIRVGINTGGPIVAGVIGTEKPTFELLGPAINIAHLMESHGVPMKVHISRSVYELIYGQEFDIKEHDEIDIKGGMMFTYIVEP